MKSDLVFGQVRKYISPGREWDVSLQMDFYTEARAFQLSVLGRFPRVEDCSLGDSGPGSTITVSLTTKRMERQELNTLLKTIKDWWDICGEKHTTILAEGSLSPDYIMGKLG